MPKFRSSIFSFSTLDLRSVRPHRGWLAALAVVVAFELGLHAVRDRLPPPRLWGEGEASTKIAEYERFAEEQGGVDLLVLGPSHASVGIDAATLGAALTPQAPRVFNAGLMGRDYPVVDFVLAHALLPTATPTRALITVSPICFNANTQPLAHNTLEFMEAPAPRRLRATGFERMWLDFLTQDLFLYRYRYRQPGLAEGRVGGRRVLDEHGWHPIDGVFDVHDRAELNSGHHPYQDVWRDFSFGGPAVASLRTMIVRLQAAGADVALVNMPFRPALFELPGDGRAAYAAYEEEVVRLAEALQFRLLNAQADLELTDAEFEDADHLNRAGAAKLSRWLAARLAPE